MRGFAAKVIFHVREADWMEIAQRFSAGSTNDLNQSP
mgnify:CR=1 FL=1